MLTLSQATHMLRAAGESTRLRLLALCALREWSVTELAACLGQSEPRVSRHLKVLCEAGLLRRARRGQWVCYAAADEGDGAWLVGTLLARIAPADAVRRRDAQRAAGHAREARPMAPRASRLGRAVAAFVAEAAPDAPLERVLIVEPMHLDVVEAAATLARHVTIVAASAAAREALRDHCDRHRVDADIRAKLGAGQQRWDAALFDFTGSRHGAGVEAALREAHARLTRAASLWIVLPYEFLEFSRGNVVGHPIAELRRLLAAAGFATQKLKPIEADGAHVLVAFAHQADSMVSAA